MLKSDGVIKKSIFMGLFIIFSALILHFTVRTSYLTYFLIIYIIERILESYYTDNNTFSPGKSLDKYSRRVIKAFTFMILASTLEFYFLHREINTNWASFGGVLILMSLGIRWWSIRSMGNEWSIHTFSVPKSIHRKIPYKIIRHPINSSPSKHLDTKKPRTWGKIE